jgi:hypothetical protein
MSLIVNGKSKLSLAFAAGAVVALSELELLSTIHTIRGVGSGNILLGFFQLAFRQPDLQLRKHFLNPLLQFCNDPVEGDCIIQRVFHPTRWLQSWEQELFHYFNRLWGKDALYAQLPVPNCRLEYTSSLSTGAGSLLVINTDNPCLASCDKINIALPANATTISHLVCSGTLKSFQLTPHVHTNSCVETDPFGFFDEDVAIVIDSLPRHYTSRHAANIRSAKLHITATENNHLRAAFHDDEISVVDLMNLFEQEQTSWESIPFSVLFQAANWGHALVYLNNNTKTPKRLLFPQAEDTYNIKQLFQLKH